MSLNQSFHQNLNTDRVVPSSPLFIESTQSARTDPEAESWRHRWPLNHVWTITSILSEKRLPFGKGKIRKLIREGKLKQHLPDNRTIFILESSIREYEGSPVPERATRKTAVVRVSAMARVA